MSAPNCLSCVHTSPQVLNTLTGELEPFIPATGGKKVLWYTQYTHRHTHTIHIYM
jgi:hypothetical protein